MQSTVCTAIRCIYGNINVLAEKICVKVIQLGNTEERGNKMCSELKKKMKNRLTEMYNILKRQITVSQREITRFLTPFIQVWDNYNTIHGQHHAKTCPLAYVDSKAQISLCIRAVWSGPLLYAIECIYGEQIPKWNFAHAQDESASVHFAHAPRHLSAWSGLHIWAQLFKATSLLVVKMLTVLVSTIFNCKCQSFSHFSAKILAYFPYLMIKVLTIR